MLLRSLFIAAVSSHKVLLIPSLNLLSFFATPNRSFPFNVDRNPVLKAILKRTLYNQFCAGETEQETRACVAQLKDLGFKGVILTYAKEMVFDHKNGSANHHTSDKFFDEKAVVVHDTDIEAWRAGTLRTLDLISEGDILALK
jgi:pyrroline-5-carboxylate reductase